MKISRSHYLKALCAAFVIALLSMMVSCSGGDNAGSDQGGKSSPDGKSEGSGSAAKPSTDGGGAMAGEDGGDISEDLGDSYRVVMEMEAGGQLTRIENKVWGKDKRAFALYLKDGDDWKLTTMLIVNGDDMYTMEPNTKMAMKTKATEDAIKGMETGNMVAKFRYKDVEKKFGSNSLEKKGKEKINGIDTVKYAADSAGMKASVWVDDNDFVRKMEVMGPGGNVISSMTLIKAEKKDYTDDDFKPGPKYKVQEINIPGFDPSKIPGMPGGGN